MAATATACSAPFATASPAELRAAILRTGEPPPGTVPGKEIEDLISARLGR
jgi:hypothetical protein